MAIETIEVESGGLVADGFADVVWYSTTITKWGIGDTLYFAGKAQRGMKEKVVVKEVRTIRTKKTHGKRIDLYVDTFNGLWNEWDLVTEYEADEMIWEASFW